MKMLRPLKRRKGKVMLGVGVVSALVMLASPAFAQDAEPDAVTVLGTQVNLLWVIIGAVLVIFMQAGFALVETGFCRATRRPRVSTNFAIFGLGFIAFFLVVSRGLRRFPTRSSG
jgi:Amt family ammonium transporter